MIPRILTIAGSDSSGGAGIQADIKTIMAMGGYAASAITAITAQNTTTVDAIEILSTDIIEAQIQLMLDDIGVDAFKTGMLPNVAIIDLVARIFKDNSSVIRVVDPVMIASSGSRLVDKKAIRAYKDELLPLVDILTPNIPEAETLLAKKISTREDQLDAASALQHMTKGYVLLKGGHSQDETVLDILHCPNGRQLYFEHARIPTNHTHGTGCSLASAIACLAVTHSVEDAAEKAIEYVNQAIVTAPGLGKGFGPINHHLAVIV